MDAGAYPRAAPLLQAMQAEFPTFALRYKRDSGLQRAIHVALRVLTLGGQRVYLTGYYTVLFGTLWVPDAWDHLDDVGRYVLLCHERIHLRQRRRMGDLVMAVLYLFWFFPVGLAYGRARIEWEAYEETMRATYEIRGRDATLALRPWLLARFTGPDYGWMWPFPKAVGRWFDDALARLDAAKSSPGSPS